MCINFINEEYLEKYLKDNVKELIINYIDRITRIKIQETVDEIINNKKIDLKEIINDKLLMNDLRRELLTSELFENQILKIIDKNDRKQ